MNRRGTAQTALKALRKADLASLVGRVQELLWRDGEVWDGEKEWDGDTIELVAQEFAAFGLRPETANNCELCGERTDDIGECGYCWDCCRSVCNHRRKAKAGCFVEPPTCEE